MTPSDLITLAGTVAGIGAAGIAILRYIIRAELAPISERLHNVEVRMQDLEKSEPVSAGLCDARRGSCQVGVPVKG